MTRSPAAAEVTHARHKDTNDLTGSAGGGAAHNNMPPYLVMNWIIKT